MKNFLICVICVFLSFSATLLCNESKFLNENEFLSDFSLELIEDIETAESMREINLLNQAEYFRGRGDSYSHILRIINERIYEISH